MLVDPLYIFSGEMSVQILCSFLNWVVWVLLLHFRSSLSILVTNSLLYTWLRNIYSHFVVCPTHTFFLLHCAAGGILVFWPGIKTTVSPALEVWTLNPVGCLLTLKLCPLTHKLFFYLMKCSLSIFSLCCLYCWFISKKSLQNPILWCFSSLGSSKSFMLLAL